MILAGRECVKRVIDCAPPTTTRALEEVRNLTSSTPDALWSSRSVALLQPAAVQVRGLRERGRRPLLDGVDLEVLVGARLLIVSDPEPAAGRLLRLLSGLVRPRAGWFRMAGLARDDDGPQGWARRVAYVPAASGIRPWLTPGEVLQVAAELAGYEPAEARDRIAATVVRFRLGAELARTISRGGPPLDQRVALAAALLTDPEVILLEDPLRSLEPSERSRLLRISGRRRTVLLASRYPASEAGLVNRVVLLERGRVALDADLGKLERHGLPLSLRGIRDLARLRSR